MAQAKGSEKVTVRQMVEAAIAAKPELKDASAKAIIEAVKAANGKDLTPQHIYALRASNKPKVARVAKKGANASMNGAKAVPAEARIYQLETDNRRLRAALQAALS